MLSERLNKRLEGIEDATKKGYLIRNLYKLMVEPDLWMMAYAKIHSNEGAVTPGVDNNTLDGFSHDRVRRIIKSLQEKTYRPKPVRRTYLPKENGKKRPLGIPSGDDKLVQEATRIILERVYEPVLSESTHGFRKGRSCHTALSEIGTRWNGTKWIIDVDIKGFFDNIDHKILLGILKKKIDDKRFIRLIDGMLKAGYVEDWVYNKTYSGTPQGGVISPILANIYLNELDQFIAGLRTFNSGKARRWNPEYQHHRYKIHKYRKKIDAMKDDASRHKEVETLLREIDRHHEVMRSIPSQDMSDPNFKRLKYSRYADDFIIGIIGSKEDAEHIMRQVRNFITQELRLKVNEEKTDIRHIEDGCQYLGYVVRQTKGEKTLKGNLHGRHSKRRTTSSIVSLYVPDDVTAKFCQKHGYGDYQNMRSAHRANLLALSEPEIITTYNAELRGLSEYYALACDVKKKLGKLFYMAHHSLFKTISNKRKVQCMKKIIRMLSDGRGEYVYHYTVDGKEYGMKVYQLKHLNRKGKDWQVDKVSTTAPYTLRTTELVERLNANKCEYCGSEGPCEIHHVRKLKDLKRKREKSLLERMMIARQRKTMVLCPECHKGLHRGTLPDVRHLATA